MFHSYKLLRSSDSPSLLQPLPGRNTPALLQEAPLHKGSCIWAALSLRICRIREEDRLRLSHSRLPSPPLLIHRCLCLLLTMARLSPDSDLHCPPPGVCPFTANSLHERDSVSSQYHPGQLFNNSVAHFHSGRGLEANHPNWDLQRWLGEGALFVEGSKQSRGWGNPHSVGQANAAAWEVLTLWDWAVQKSK